MIGHHGPPAFGHDQALGMTIVAAGAVAATQPNAARLREAVADASLLATEAADLLVRKGVPFRDAHEAVGHAVLEAEQKSQSWIPSFAEKQAGGARLTPQAALASKSGPGGTAPDSVRAAITDCRARLTKAEEAR